MVPLLISVNSEFSVSEDSLRVPSSFLFLQQLLHSHVDVAPLALLVIDEDKGDGRELELLLQVAPLGAGDVDVLALDVVGLSIVQLAALHVIYAGRQPSIGVCSIIKIKLSQLCCPPPGLNLQTEVLHILRADVELLGLD